MTPSDFLETLYQQNYDFITGVPDSLFKQLLTAVKNDERFQHVITNNEGESCALATGYHLATGKVPVVYMQNSGLGNCINPLTSLLDEWIYAIPCLLLISWRASPGEHDEPQHQRMGSILLDLLSLLNIPYLVIDANTTQIEEFLFKAKTLKKPFALIFTKNTLDTPIPTQSINEIHGTNREEVLEFLVRNNQPNHLFITTTGKTSRELYEIRERLNQPHDQDFLTVGSMGCASTIALGIAMQRPEKQVIVIDGDGACLMRLEALATIGHIKPSNLLHILIDNNAYESTGAQQTQSHHIDFTTLALACGYQHSIVISELNELLEYLNTAQGPTMLIVRTTLLSRENLGRPKKSALENKQSFMNHLGVM